MTHERYRHKGELKNLGEILREEITDHAMSSYNCMRELEDREDAEGLKNYFRAQGQKDMCVLLLNYVQMLEKKYQE